MSSTVQAREGRRGEGRWSGRRSRDEATKNSVIAVRNASLRLGAPNSAETPSSNSFTHMAVLVQVVVGQLDLLEGDVVLHPLRAGRGRVGVDEIPEEYFC